MSPTWEPAANPTIEMVVLGRCGRGVRRRSICLSFAILLLVSSAPNLRAVPRHFCRTPPLVHWTCCTHLGWRLKSGSSSRTEEPKITLLDPSSSSLKKGQRNRARVSSTTNRRQPRKRGVVETSSSNQSKRLFDQDKLHQ